MQLVIKSNLIIHYVYKIFILSTRQGTLRFNVTEINNI